MKNAFLLSLVLICSTGFSQAVLKTVGNAAKNKLEGEDFNASRTNKQKANLSNENQKAPAPASAPAPKPDSSAVPVSSSNDNTVTSGSRTFNRIYSFDKIMTYETSNQAKPGKAPETVTYSYSNGAVMTQMSQNANMIIVTDFPNEAALTFDEKNKTVMVMSTRWATNMAQNFAADKEVTITKTGQTKEILGKKCEEYLITDKKGKTSCFITTEVKMNYAKTIEALTKNKVSTGGSSEFPAECLMMEMTYYNKKGEAENHMIMKSYSEENSTKSIESYKVTAL